MTTNDTMALILAGGRGSRLDILSWHRAKPSVPFGGRYRIIDFALSNCVNSGIDRIGVLTQYLPLSLHNHIGIGKPWDLDRKHGGVTLLQPYTGLEGEDGWYKGTAEAVKKNIRFLKKINAKHTLILSGDHVYIMDYRKMIDFHEKNGADVTIAAQNVTYEEAKGFGIVDTDENMRVKGFLEKPEDPPSTFASMGIYVFETEMLIEALEKYSSEETSDFGHHIIPELIGKNNIFCYEYEGYWRDAGTFEAYHDTNMELAGALPRLNLYDKKFPIHTRDEELPPVKFGNNGRIKDSLISNGCIINGTVENSVLSPGVIVEDGAIVRDSIIFNHTVIKKNAIICKAIIDKRCVINASAHVGFGTDMSPNREEPEILNNGLTVISKGVEVPSNTTIGRNCRIFSYVDDSDFEGGVVKSGSTLKPKVKVKL